MGFKTKLLIVAMASAMPLVSVQAQTQTELQKEIAALRAQLQSLQQKVEAMGAKAEASAPPAAVAQQVNRLEQRLDLADDEAEATGFTGLTIKGQVDPTLIYNRNSDSFTPVFMSNDGKEWGYDNSSFGQAMLEFAKETEDGNKFVLRLTPKSSAGLIHEATASIPLGEGVALNAGLTPDYSGYEMAFGADNPLVTHNLLFDFTAATNYTGVGTSHEIGDVAAKWMMGVIDSATRTSADSTTTPVTRFQSQGLGLAYRVDYSLGEFSGIGFSGVHGTTQRTANNPGFTQGSSFNLMEIDGFQDRGDWSLRGQMSWGNGGSKAANAGNAEWVGLSALVGYKFTPRLQGLVRADYLINEANTGGVYGTNNDELNGFGASSSDATKGANRYALSVGLNYLINSNASWKLEVRHDSADGDVFKNQATGNMVRDNMLLGTSLVVKF